MESNHFINLGEGLDMILHDPNANKMNILTELFITASGRLNRQAFIYRTLFVTLFFSVISGILTIISTLTIGFPFYVIQLVLAIINTVCGFTLSIRRLHDMDRCGLWALFLWVPLLNLILSVFLLFKRGTDGPNSYGQDLLQ